MAWLMTQATQFSVQLQASLGLWQGREYYGSNLFSCQANMKKRLPSFLHYTTGMLGDAPEMCWGWEKVKDTLLFPLEDHPQKERKMKSEF